MPIAPAHRWEPQNVKGLSVTVVSPGGSSPWLSNVILLGVVIRVIVVYLLYNSPRRAPFTMMPSTLFWHND